MPAATGLPAESLTWTVMIEVPLQPRVAGDAEIVRALAGPTVVVGVTEVVAVAVGVREMLPQSTVSAIDLCASVGQIEWSRCHLIPLQLS